MDERPGPTRISGEAGWTPLSVERLQEVLPAYEVIELLGVGGMGAVYKARQKSLKRLVAIKILPTAGADDEFQFVERFRNEAETLAQMNHAAIVNVYDFGETPNGLLYFVMEFVDGTDVHKMIQSSGKLSAEHALSITAHVCDALAYAHRHGVIHRDIKPANILINREGHVKVADFGLAKMHDPAQTSGLTRTNMTMGTPDYAAPEVFKAGMVTDHRADLYAVGVMLYQMLTGEVPRGFFKLPSEGGADPRFDAIIVKAMEANRDERFQSALEVRHALDEILTTPLAKDAGTGAISKSSPPQRSRVTPSPQPAPTPTASPGKAKVFVIAAIVLVLGVAGFFVTNGKKPSVNAATATAPAKSRVIDLLALVEPKRDALVDEWVLTPEGLAKPGVANPPGKDSPTLQLPYQPSAEFDFEIEFTAKGGNGSVGQIIATQAQVFSWILSGGSGGKPTIGFEQFDTKPTSVASEVAKPMETPLENNRRYRSRVEVRTGALRAFLDGQLIIDWKGDLARFGRSTALRNTNRLGLRANRPVVFHKIEVREITGAGKVDASPTANAAPTATAPSASPPTGHAVDLLPLVDVKRDALAGEWSRDGADLLVKAAKSGADGSPRLQLPYQPPEEYDFEMEFTPESGGKQVVQILTAYQRAFTWQLDVKLSAGMKAGFDRIGGKSLFDVTDGTAMRPSFLTTGRRHRSTVEVRRTGLRGLLDGQRVVAWGSKPESYQSLDIHSNDALRDALHLGIGGYDRAVRFHRITVREITGAGKVDASPAPVAVTTIDWLKADIWRAPWVVEQGALKVTSKTAMERMGQIGDGAIRVRLRDVGVPATSSAPPLQFMVRYSPIAGTVAKDGDYLFQIFPQKRTCTLIYLEKSRADGAEKTETLWTGKTFPAVQLGATELDFEIRAEGDELSVRSGGIVVASARDARLKTGKCRIIADPGIEITRLETVGVTDDGRVAVPAAAEPLPAITNWQDVTARMREQARSMPALAVEADAVRHSGKSGTARVPLTRDGVRDYAVRVGFTGEAQVDLRVNDAGGFIFILCQRSQTIFQRYDKGVVDPAVLRPSVLHPAGYDSAQPHELLVTMQGPTIRAWLDGRFVGEARDETFKDGVAALSFTKWCVVQKLEIAELGANPAPAPMPAQTFSGHRYQFVPGTLNWKEAKANAEKLGGHLATIESAEENDWAWRTFSSQLPEVPKEERWTRGWWLGGSQLAPEQPWTWLTDDPLSYTKWGPSEPRAAIVPPRGLWMADDASDAHGSKWSAQKTTWKGGFLVEWDTPGR